MKDLTELVASLREDATWAEANIWEVPIMLPDHLTQAADFLEKLPSVQHGKLEGEDKMRSCSNCARKEAGEVCQLCFQADRWTPRAKTNADLIRAMNDEELAEMLTTVVKKCAISLFGKGLAESVDFGQINEAHIDWLSQEVPNAEENQSAP